MDVNINPFNRGNPMSFKDAAVVAAIAAFAVWILQFFANAQYTTLVAAPGAWAFEAVKSYAVNWAGTFIALAGLEQLVKKGEKPSE